MRWGGIGWPRNCGGWGWRRSACRGNRREARVEAGFPASTTAGAGRLKAARQGQLRPVFQLPRQSSSGEPSWSHSFARRGAADLRQASCRIPEMKVFITLAMSRNVQRLPWSEQRRSAGLSAVVVALRSGGRPGRRDQHLRGCRGANDGVPLCGRQSHILGMRRCWRVGLAP